MTRHYATPAAFKQAVEHRLREEAAGDGVELARLRQRLIFDRLCARVVNVFKELAGKIYGSPFGVDVAIAEPLVGEAEEVEGSRLLVFAGVEPTTFRLYPLEAHIAEKLHAYTLPRERPNSRVKDLPDLALLASVRTIDGEELRAAIERTFEHRGTHPIPAATPQAPAAWASVYKRMARSDGLSWPTLDEVTEVVRIFLDPVLSGVSGRWIPAAWAWDSGPSGCPIPD